MSDATRTPVPPNLIQRLTAATRFVISGAGPESWFGPQQPLAPQAPADVKGRQWDYPFGVNINYIPRSDAGVSFEQLRTLADALPLLRAVIETRKDQIAALNYTIRPRRTGASPARDAPQRIAKALAFLARPDRRHGFDAWLRLWLEDMLVIDAATIYPRLTKGGELYALDIVDGATIKPLIGEDGRPPDPPDPAYQQVLHGVPAADFSADELIYLPRNPRAHRLYGMSPVEQVALSVNIALRRETATLDYYRTGSTPDSFATLPKEWTVDQIRQFQDYFDALMSGNLARRRMVKFMPSEFKLIETRQPPLKDQYDEWLARVICYAFSVPASPFVTQVNRATSQNLRQQALQEGLAPLKAWVKGMLDGVLASHMNAPDLEFTWVGDDAVDPLQQAQTLSILVKAGIKTREEARADLGLTGAAPALGGEMGKFNPYHDERGRFATGPGEGEEGGGEAPEAAPPQSEPTPAVTPHAKPTGLQVADNRNVVSDVPPDSGAAKNPDSGSEPASPTKTDEFRGLSPVCIARLKHDGTPLANPMTIKQSTLQVLPSPTVDELRSNGVFRNAMLKALSDSGIDAPISQRHEVGFWVFQNQSNGELAVEFMDGRLSMTSMEPLSPSDRPGSTIVAWAHTHPYDSNDKLAFWPTGMPEDFIRCPSGADLNLSRQTGLTGFVITKSRGWSAWTPNMPRNR